MESYSQVGQDVWVRDILKLNRPGYFVDVGAYDGINISNTYLFEKHYNWDGICIEANPIIYEVLKKNRRCQCVNALLDCSEGLQKQLQCVNELSYVSNDNNKHVEYHLNNLRKENGLELRFEDMVTTTLENILNTYECKSTIDYLSIDIEGMEYDVLKLFPFNKYHINAITIEHNAPHCGDEYRDKLTYLLEMNGFIFVKGNDDIQNWGHGPIDDFYINRVVKL